MPPTRRLLMLAPLALLAGCNAVVLDPSGHVAEQQKDLLLLSVWLMLIIILPVTGLTVFFAWKYRASNKESRYEPDWDHSTHLELVIWAAPLLIIICLGAATWAGTHLLDPYRPLTKIDHARTVAADQRPLEVQVVALDWKWLFIYPEYGVATVNELAAPLDRPVRFSLTSSSVMNSFYIPALAGQIYAMPGMETKLHGVINAAGSYKGFSANYSGDGFSSMKFTFKGLEQADFEAWITKARAGGATLDRGRYLELERPSEKTPVMRFGAVDPGLWSAIVNMCVEPGKMCMGEMMAIDDRGGLGLSGVHNTLPLTYDKYARRGATPFGGIGEAYVLAICTPEEAARLAAAGEARDERLMRTVRSVDPLVGAGLLPPASRPRSYLSARSAALDPRS